MLRSAKKFLGEPSFSARLLPPVGADTCALPSSDRFSAGSGLDALQLFQFHENIGPVRSQMTTNSFGSRLENPTPFYPRYRMYLACTVHAVQLVPGTVLAKEPRSCLVFAASPTNGAAAMSRSGHRSPADTRKLVI